MNQCLKYSFSKHCLVNWASFVTKPGTGLKANIAMGALAHKPAMGALAHKPETY